MQGAGYIYIKNLALVVINIERSNAPHENISNMSISILSDNAREINCDMVISGCVRNFGCRLTVYSDAQKL